MSETKQIERLEVDACKLANALGVLLDHHLDCTMTKEDEKHPAVKQAKKALREANYQSRQRA